MLVPTIEEVKETFSAAKNINAALKNVLKKEVKPNDALGKLVKHFRVAITSNGSTASFIEKNYPGREPQFLIIGRYAHNDVVNLLVDQIYNLYADSFNKCYTSSPSGVTITDEKGFDTIVKDVDKKIENGIKAAGLPVNAFMKNIFLVSIFEMDVLREVLPRLSNA